MTEKRWAVGVDLGGTKVEVACVDEDGNLFERVRRPTDAADGPAAVEDEVVSAIEELLAKVDGEPVAVGVGIAGQIEPDTGQVRFAPNLDWHDVPLQADLHRALNLPVIVTNDVRAITWGEWHYGAGVGCDDLICMFVGTGIGAGVVSGGRMLAGCSNTAGEVGHITVDMHGPACHCGNQGCLEALAGGWAIARRAREAVRQEPEAGAALLKRAGKLADITAETVADAAHGGDPLALRLVDEVAEALIAGSIGLANAFNPCRLILGGGVIEGLPQLVDRVGQGVQARALSAAAAPLEVVLSQLHGDAGVVGAAALVLHASDEALQQSTAHEE